VQEYASAQKKLQDECRVLREQMRQMEATITKLQVSTSHHDLHAVFNQVIGMPACNASSLQMYVTTANSSSCL
jgi:hypothetical protein